MLIRFTVENFLSFNKRIDFNLIASEDNHLNHHIIQAKSENDISLLRTSIIYGANASGKSNIIKAMAFAKDFIVNGVSKTENIELYNFKLDKTCYQKPSRFEFEFRYKDKQYAYGFVIDKRQVYEEWLFEIGHQLEIPIFERSPNGIDFNFAYEDLSAIAKPELIYEANHTRKNLLFITNCKEREIKQFEFIYEWFDEILNIILPNSKPLSLTIQSNTDFEIFFKHILIHFDLGIKDIYFKPINFEKEIPDKIQKQIIKFFPYGENKVCFVATSDYLIIKEDNLGQLQASKLITTRSDEDNHNIAFEILEESDGTQRLIDLIPMLIGLSQAKVFVVDEIENSLHALIIKQLFDFILNSKFFINIESQLIATTHEIFLLDIKKLFRKDEIWFMKKHQNRESRIYSLAYADIEKLDLMKGYINGRFGAIPFIPNIKEFNWNI